MFFDFSTLFKYVKNDLEAVLSLLAIYSIIKNFKEQYKHEKIEKLYLVEDLEDVISLVIETDKNKYSVVIRDSKDFIISPTLKKSEISYYTEG